MVSAAILLGSYVARVPHTARVGSVDSELHGECCMVTLDRAPARFLGDHGRNIVDQIESHFTFQRSLSIVFHFPF